jgi:hypothetical protein
MTQRAEAKYTIRATDRTGGAMRSVQRNLKGVAVAMVATFGARAVVGLINNTAKDMDELAKSSRRLGMSAKDMDAWGFVAELNGASAETMTKSIKKLSTGMYDAGLGLKTYTDIFEDLGVEYKNQDGTLRGVNDVLFDTADALNGMQNQAQKTAIEVKLFGRTGLDMALILGQGKDALKEQLKEGYSMGTMYADLVTNGEDYVDAQLRMNRSIRNVKAVITASALPALASFGDALSEQIMDKLTGVKDAFRTELAELAMMPARMSLAKHIVRADELDDELTKLQPLYERATDAMADMYQGGITAQQMMNSGIKGSGDRYVELQNQIKLVYAVIADLRKQVGTMDEVQAYYNESLGETVEVEKTDAEIKEQKALMVKKLTSAQGSYNAMMTATRSELDALRTPQVEYNDRIDELQKRLGAGELSWLEYGILAEEARQVLLETYHAVDGLVDSFENLESTGVNSMQEIWRVGDLAMTSLSTSIAKTVTEGTNLLESLQSISMTILQQFISTLIQMGISGAMNRAGSYSYGEFSADYQGATGQNFGNPYGFGLPTRASGGAVVAGRSYLVGENNPEIFTPTQGGIISNAPANSTPLALGINESAGANITIEMNINALDSRDVLNVISEQKSAIVGMVQQEFIKRGMRGFTR